MPRPRSFTIAESPELLRSLEADARDDAERLRLTAIRYLRENPSLTIPDVARAIEASERTVKNWLSTYRRDGLDGVRRLGSGSRPIDADVEREIARRTIAGEFRSASAMRMWLRRTHAITISLPTAVALLDRCSRDESSRRHASDCRREADWLFELMRALPERVEAREFLEQFRRSLASFLDVDRVSVDLNIHAMQPKPETPAEPFVIEQEADGDSGDRLSVAVHAVDTTTSRAQQLLARIRASGLEVEKYHEPLAREYHLADGRYLGTIILWKARHRPSIGDGIAAALDRLERVIVRLLLDCAARHDGPNSASHHFYEALSRMVTQARLTPTERHAVTMRLLGHSYKEIAATMNTTLDNVAKHLSSVHRKTGTAGLPELHARYFSPRL